MAIHVDVASMARHAEAVLDELGWESAHIAGHSLGGVIAQALAIHAPARVTSLALLCTFLNGRAPPPCAVALSTP